MTINEERISLNQVESILNNQSIEIGGRWAPNTCRAKQKIAVIVPYEYKQDRNYHKPMFLRHMHTFLKNQSREYGIYLVESTENLQFNRGRLMNIGFIESLKDNDKWDCFIFHDIDLLPQNLNNFYKCDPTVPLHLVVLRSNRNYK